MTRSEAKAVLVAWKKAARALSAACRSKALLLKKLSNLSELSGSPAVDITVTGKDSTGNIVSEPGYAFLPRGNSTGDPTARVAEQRMEIKRDLDAITAEVDVLEDYYMAVLRLVTQLPEAHAKILHLHYCTANPGYTTSAGKENYYNRLRAATTALQALDAPPIPDILKEDDPDGL